MKNTAARWDGATLHIDALVSGRAGYHQVDRWALAGRDSLRIERRITRGSTESRAFLMYTRERADAQTLSPRPRPADAAEIVVPAGTRIPLALISALSTRTSEDGDRIYMESAFPVVIGGRIAIPRGAYVIGTVTRARRPGRVVGKGELYLRFDALTLPNGTTRGFRSRMGAADGDIPGHVDSGEGKIAGEGEKAHDARRIADTAGAGASLGGIAGAVAGSSGLGAGIGGAAGAATGIALVLLTRGPDVILPKGTTIEMILDRDLRFRPEELNF